MRLRLKRRLSGMVELLVRHHVLLRVLSAERRALIERFCSCVARSRGLSRMRGVRHRRMRPVRSLRLRVDRVRVLLRHCERICERSIGWWWLLLLLLLLHRRMVRRDRHALNVARHFRMIRSMGVERHHDRWVVWLRLHSLDFM